MCLLCALHCVGIFTYLICLHLHYNLTSRFRHHHFINENTEDRSVQKFSQVHTSSQGCSQT